MRQVVLFLSLGAVARATVLVERDTAALVARSDAVVRARVRAQRALSPDSRNIVTDSELEVIETLRGGAPARLTVRTWGGTIGVRSLDVEGVARLRAGGEYLLFLKRAGDRWAVSGMAQGAYEIAGGEAVRQVDAPLLRPGRHGLRPLGSADRRLPLAELIAEIRRAP